MPFEELQHTGDLQYRVTAVSDTELFSECSRALFSTITDPSVVDAVEERTVETSGSAHEELLINFLRECLRHFHKDEFIARECTVSTKSASHVEATLRGERFDPKRHSFRTEIKAVTYHGAEVHEQDEEWIAIFTLDL